MDFKNLDINGDKLSDDQQNQLLFLMLVQQHQQIARMGLGKDEDAGRDLKTAKYAIDTLYMLQKFTEGNLSNELKTYLEQTLNNLRIGYAEEKKKGKSDREKGEGREES